MKIFTTILAIAVFSSAFVISAGVMAQTATNDNASTDTTMSKTADMTYGEVRKIDTDGSKLTLRHGKIKNLDMPPMTMVFMVNDKNMLDKLKVGDKVKFKAIKDNGKLTVTDIKVDNK